MKKVIFAAIAAALVAAPVLVLAFAPAPDAGSRTVEHKVIDGYGVSRDAGLKGDASFLAVTSKTEFDRLFYPIITRRGLPDPVGKNAFDTRLFVAVNKLGDVLYEYKVEKVTANGDTLTVQYTVAPFKGASAIRGTTGRAYPLSSGKGDTFRAERDTPRDTPKARADTEKKTEVERGETKAARGETVKEGPKATSAARTTEAVAVRDTSRSRDASTGFDSSLIVSVPKDKYLTVVFIENGRKVGTARVGN